MKTTIGELKGLIREASTMPKMDLIRLRNLFAAIEKANDAAERLARSEDPDTKALAGSLVSRLEDMSMEVGMAIADAEDGTPIG